MEKHILSKSTFIKGYHCLKSLYLYKNRPFLRDKMSAEQRAKFRRGHHVGDLAQQLFPGGIDVSPKSPSQYQKSVVQTAELIEQGQEIIYEATFQFDQVLVMLDLLVKTEKGWQAYEVKSSKKLSETYFTDAALQYYVIENSGLKLEQFFLVYVDENYRLQGELDLNKYFILQNVTQQLIEKQDFIASKIAEEKAILLEKNSPKVAVGDHCFSPYQCDFVGFCWKKINEKPYLPQTIDLRKIRLDKTEQISALGLIFSEQAVPECENEKAYFLNCIGFQIGEEEAVIAGKSCEDKKKFLASFFEKIESHQRLVTFDKTKMTYWLEEIKIQFPELEAKIDQVIQSTLGILEILEEQAIIEKETRNNYSIAYLSQSVLSDTTLSSSAIYSDILAVELFSKMQADLWGNDSPDLHSLQEYLKLKTQATLGLHEQF